MASLFGAALLLGGAVLLGVGCDVTAELPPGEQQTADGGTSSDTRDAGGSGGQPSTDGVGGTGGDAAGDDVGGAGSCDATAEDYCAAHAEWAACDGPAPDVYEACITEDAPYIERYDSCVIAGMIDCFDGCEPDADTECVSQSIFVSRPDVVDAEQQALCVMTEWNSGGGGEEPTSCIERHKGWARECADFARSCDTTYNACPSAALLRADLLVLADQCLEQCAGLNVCLNNAIHGE